ncbi:MAG: helix-turn-helix domain-containing protein [Elusimicrobiota bacterium]
MLGSDKFFEWVKDNFIKPKNLEPHTHLKGVMAMPVKDIADAVARNYQIKIDDILKKKSKHIEARNILIELSYLSNIHSKSMTEIGRELGGISGSGVCYAHKRIRDRLNKDKDFKENFDGIASLVACQDSRPDPNFPILPILSLFFTAKSR